MLPLRPDYPHMNDATFRSASSVPYVNRSTLDGTRSALSYGYGATVETAYRGSTYAVVNPYASVLQSAIDSERRLAQLYRELSGVRYAQEEQLKRANLRIAMANGGIHSPCRRAVLHPMQCLDGGYPDAFPTPYYLEDFLAISDGQLKRILAAYGLLPGSERHIYALRDPWLAERYGYLSTRPQRVADLVALFDYLAAHHLAQELRRRSRDGSIDLNRPHMCLFGGW